MSSQPRVLVVMPGHLSTTPRMLKAADSLSAAGYHVRVISAGFLDWAREADRRTAASRRWEWEMVDHSRPHAPFLHLLSGARRHVARSITRTVSVDRVPWWACTRALSRVHDELVSRARSRPFDFVYGGSTGGLAVAEELARLRGVPFAIDLEDLHTAESVAPDAPLHHALSRRVLTRILPRVAFATTSTECMRERYREEFGVAPAVLHNVFPLPARPPAFDRTRGPLRLYWFSQTIGPGRGIEDVLSALQLANIPSLLTLRGRSAGAYISDLRRRIATMPNVDLTIEEPADPDRMVDLCAGYDVGFSAEVDPVENKQVCLGNKVFTYLLGGMPVALSDTRAQRCLASTLGDAAFVYSPNDLERLAAWLRALSDDEERLQRHRLAAWRAAERRWHWGHAEEEGQLLSLVRQATA